MRVALFVTCLTDTCYPATGRAVVRLLERPSLLDGGDIPPTYELSEFLVDVLGVVDVGAHFPDFTDPRHGMDKE